MSVLLIAGSPSAPSRSTALLEAVGERLAKRHARIERLAIRDLPAIDAHIDARMFERLSGSDAPSQPMI